MRTEPFYKIGILLQVFGIAVTLTVVSLGGLVLVHGIVRAVIEALTRGR